MLQLSTGRAPGVGWASMVAPHAGALLRRAVARAASPTDTQSARSASTGREPSVPRLCMPPTPVDAIAGGPDAPAASPAITSAVATDEEVAWRGLVGSCALPRGAHRPPPFFVGPHTSHETELLFGPTHALTELDPDTLGWRTLALGLPPLRSFRPTQFGCYRRGD